MSRMIFVNLPVSNVAASTAFYETVGATRDPRFCDDSASMVKFSDTIALMLLSRERFAGFTSKTIIDARTHVQTLIALSADNREAVDDMVAKAEAANGRPDANPVQDYGFMYGRSFEDLDGHVIEVMWMDVEAALAAMNPEQHDAQETA